MARQKFNKAAAQAEAQQGTQQAGQDTNSTLEGLVTVTADRVDAMAERASETIAYITSPEYVLGLVAAKVAKKQAERAKMADLDLSWLIPEYTLPSYDRLLMGSGYGVSTTE
jgi:hypothetical protein